MKNTEEHLNLLGLKAKDKVSGMTGVITSISFDLYGCVQAVVHPKVDKNGIFGELCWFDINRLIITKNARVMPVPDFNGPGIAPGESGPEAKPAPR